jgi:Autotransporter beta-domain
MYKSALPLAVLGATTVAAISLPVESAHAACGASQAGTVNQDTGYSGYSGYVVEQSAAGSFASLPSVTTGLGRLQAAAINSAVSASSTSNCDGYTAPLMAGNMQNTRGLLRDTILRLEQLRAAKQAAGKTSMYVTSAIPSYMHAFGNYIRRHDLIVGADHRYNDQWVAGASIGLAHTNFFTSNKADGRVDGTGGSFTAYGAWSPTAASYVSAVVSADNMHYSLNNTSAVGSPARADGLNTGLSLSAGYDAQLGSWTASPFVRVDHITSRVHALDKDDTVNKGRTSSSSLGAQMSTQVSMSWGVLSPHVRIEGTRVHGWSLKGESADIYANQVGVADPSMLDRNYGQAGVGAAALYQGGLTVFSDFDRTFGMKGVTSWRFTLGLRSEL